MTYNEYKMRDLATALTALENNDILTAIAETRGWNGGGEVHPIQKVNNNIRNFLFTRGAEKLDKKDKIKLLSRFQHKKHFTNGVTKFEALSYYFLSTDYSSNEKDTLQTPFRKLGNARASRAMINYYNSLEESVIEIGRGDFDLTYLSSELRGLINQGEALLD